MSNSDTNGSKETDWIGKHFILDSIHVLNKLIYGKGLEMYIILGKISYYKISGSDKLYYTIISIKELVPIRIIPFN